jgi:hypothetical protein
MPVKSGWYDETKQIILHQFEGRWEWHDLFNAISTSKTLMDSVDHKVFIILDVSQTRALPAINIKSLQALANPPTSGHPNMAGRYLIGVRSYLRSIYNVFVKLFPQGARQYRLVDTIEEALLEIKSHTQAETP